MSQLKSAWEIAQERANRLGKLSPEEKEQQERERARDIAQALARKWLGSSEQLDIAAELDKQEAHLRNAIKQSLIGYLVEEISFTTTQGVDSAKRAVQAISSLRPDLQPKAEEINQLVQEYQKAEQKIRQGLETERREILHKLRISGTAVGDVNIDADARWQGEHHKLVEAFAPRLNALKQAMTAS